MLTATSPIISLQVSHSILSGGQGLKESFKIMDTDGSGSLDVGEVKTAMMKMGV